MNDDKPKGGTEPVASEAENVQLVKDFIQGWTATNYDLNTEFPKYLAPNVLVRMHGHMDPMNGVDATIGAMREFMTGGAGVNKVEFHDIWSSGPIVALSRTDFVTMPDLSETTFKVSAVFIVMERRIAEWSEYFA